MYDIVCIIIRIFGRGFFDLESSAMDSSTIGVGVAVLVGKCMQGPCSAVSDIRSIR